MAQIAGMMLNDSSQKFNFNIFDNEKMSVKDQLNYLKKFDCTYKQALNNDSRIIMNKVRAFLQENQVNTIVNWGNSLDFKTLKDEGYIKYFANLDAIDLEKVFAAANSSVDSEGKASFNLRAFCNLLNLKNPGIWHDALDDVSMIYRVCKLYMTITRLSNKNEKIPVYNKSSLKNSANSVISKDASFVLNNSIHKKALDEFEQIHTQSNKEMAVQVLHEFY